MPSCEPIEDTISAAWENKRSQAQLMDRYVNHSLTTLSNLDTNAIDGML
jgi:hypothetical protein